MAGESILKPRIGHDAQSPVLKSAVLWCCNICLLYRLMHFNKKPHPQLSITLGDLHPNLTRGSLGPPESLCQTTRWSGQLFVYSSLQMLPIFYNGVGHVPENCPIPWEICHPYLTCGFLDPPKSTSHTASWSVHPFLRGWLLCQKTDRHTDHTTSIARGLILHVASWCSLIKQIYNLNDVIHTYVCLSHLS